MIATTNFLGERYTNCFRGAFMSCQNIRNACDFSRFLFPQLKDVMWECGDDWGWFMTLSYPHYRDSSFVLWQSMNLQVAEEHQGYHTVSDYFLQNDPEPVAWRTRWDGNPGIRSIRIIPWANLDWEVIHQDHLRFSQWLNDSEWSKHHLSICINMCIYIYIHIRIYNYNMYNIYIYIHSVFFP